MRLAVPALAVSLVAATACATDPQYIPGPAVLEVAADPMAPTLATTTINLPIEPESMADMADRVALETELGVELAYVRVGDLDVSIEWTIKNLTDGDGRATVTVDGGNQFFYYVPANFVVDPDEDEMPPSLAGGIPLTVPANGSVSGVIREDALREASLDLEAITRGMVNPFAAVFNINEDDPTIPVGAVAIPPDAAAQMIRYDITVASGTHMVLEYALRIRDHRGIVHRGLLAAPVEELVTFTPAEYVPPPPPDE